jgi:hypothetical protein
MHNGSHEVRVHRPGWLGFLGHRQQDIDSVFQYIEYDLLDFVLVNHISELFPFLSQELDDQ